MVRGLDGSLGSERGPLSTPAPARPRSRAARRGSLIRTSLFVRPSVVCDRLLSKERDYRMDIEHISIITCPDCGAGTAETMPEDG